MSHGSPREQWGIEGKKRNAATRESRGYAPTLQNAGDLTAVVSRRSEAFKKKSNIFAQLRLVALRMEEPESLLRTARQPGAAQSALAPRPYRRRYRPLYRRCSALVSLR